MTEHLVPAFWILVGLAVLIAGGEVLVRGAAALATAARVPALVIGLTLVAFGTSAPELAVSVRSSFQGQTDLAIGNVVGSSIFNVLVVLGLSALVAPLTVAARLVRWDVPLMILASFLAFLFGLDGWIGRLDGLLLFAGLVYYTGHTVLGGRKENIEVKAEYEGQAGMVAKAGYSNVAFQIALVLVGAGLLHLGSQWLVDGCVTIAEKLGISQLTIGLTILAVGTSLPEVATSVMASIRQQRDIAVGNVVGSNILNILAVLGISGMVAPKGINVSPAALWFDIPVMIAVAVACLPIFFTGHKISRWEGALFLAYYAAYTIYLFSRAAQEQIIPGFEVLMIAFVIPLTAIGLLVSVVRALRGRNVN